MVDPDQQNGLFDEENEEQGLGIEPTPGGFAHWLLEQYQGDDRFESVEIDEPGPLEEEAVRVRFIIDDATHFMAAVLADDAIVRIGLATENKDVVDLIEDAIEENNTTLTDMLLEGLGAVDEVEYEVDHFHDDVDYFCIDIQYQREDDLFADVFRDELIYYLEGMINGFLTPAHGEDS